MRRPSGPDVFTAQSLYGAQPVAPNPGAAAAIEPSGITVGHDGIRALVDIHNPLAIFGGVLLITFGLIGASGSVKLGRAQFKASAGKD